MDEAETEHGGEDTEELYVYTRDNQCLLIHQSDYEEGLHFKAKCKT